MLASGLFLASLSPLSFRMGKFRVLYVVPYTIPLIIYPLLAHGVYRNQTPGGIMFWVFPVLVLVSLGFGVRWAYAKGTLPPSIALLACAIFGSLALRFYFRTGTYWPLILAESGNHVMTALLVISVFRRVSPGTILSVIGFLVWSLPILLIFPQFQTPWIDALLLRFIIMAKVATALGLILVALENELAANKATSERERRARRELEAYSGLVLSRRHVADFDRQGDEICRMVVAHSRFSQAALLLLHSTGNYHLSGTAGFDSATVQALNAVCPRFPVTGFLESVTTPSEATSGATTGAAPSSTPSATPCATRTATLDFHPWLLPGDDLERLRFTSALAIPMQGRTATEGALLLAGIRNPDEPLRPDDLVPAEMLTARLQSVRSQTRMLEKLIDSEKFAGLGQLAGNVTRQLNNPLTVVLGYASLLEDSPHRDPADRKGVEAILSAARSMRSTLESLQRVAKSPSGQLSAVSVNEMLTDLEQLHRPEFLQRSIEFRFNVAADLPMVLAHGQQLRQALLHCLQFAMDAVEHVEAGTDRTVRLEATAVTPHVHIRIAHSGTHFAQPDRAFDPFVPQQPGISETSGLGLSVCSTIMRDSLGRASAVNLEPNGAAILLELQAA